MKNYKYTTDGKKVVVIGDLNQTEKIVQEIFVTDAGDEIPQGERFVVKNLLDAPVKSWKETELQKLEDRYKRESAEWERKLKIMNSEKELAYESLSARVKWLRSVAKEPDRDERFRMVINTIADFLSDVEKWVFVKGCSEWQLKRFYDGEFDELTERVDYGYGRARYEGMRLLSLFGDKNRDLHFRVSDHTDGSGQSKNVFFFRSEEEAKAFIQSEFDKIETYSASDMKNAEKFNLKVDQNKLEKHLNKKKESIQKQIEEAEKKLKDLQGSMEQISTSPFGV